MLTAQSIITLLDLTPLPVEGGWFRETYRSHESTAIYYLLAPGAVSLMHRLHGDEIYHFYLGDPVELCVLFQDGVSEVITLGTGLQDGQRVQHLVPGGVWQGSRLKEGGKFALLGTTMAPPFEFSRFELGARAPLLAQYPSRHALIEALTPPG